MRLSRGRSEEGFTLIELLISITILAVISLALTMLVFEYLRNATETNTRLNESSDQQFVAAYWQQDVSSLGVHGFVAGAVAPLPSAQSVWTSDAGAPSGVPSGCSGISNTVIGFAWNDYQSGSTTDANLAWSSATVNAAVYFTKTAGTQTQLWRTRCDGSTTTTVVLARYLTKAPTVGCTDNSGASPSGAAAQLAYCTSTSPVPVNVSITVTVQDKGQAVHNATGYTTTLTAERRQG